MPLYENVKLQFIQKYILLFKVSYISLCSKIFIYTVENRKTKKDIHQASTTHLKMPEKNLKTIKFNNI